MGWAAKPSGGPTHSPGARPVATESFERFGHLAVGSSPAVGTQVLIERVPDQGMGEGVAPGIGQLANEGRDGGGFEDVEQVVLVGLGGASEQSRGRSRDR